LRTPVLLDLFCGVGGWSRAFMAGGWRCVGVDITPQPDYPGEFIRASVYDLPGRFLEDFDGVALSPPCEEFARACMPWLRGDFKP
jgi:DNA (cytosine-5)-methyltransferase 1